MRRYGKLLMTIAALGLFVAACANPAAGAAPSTAANPTALPATGSVTDTAGPAATATPVATASSPSGAVYNVVPDGTQAGYRVREQLARLSFPSDAVGTTTAVTGSIALGSDGKVLADQSKLVVDLTSLKSDSGGRDRFIQRNTLDTASYPTAVFVPTEIQGLPSPLPTSGAHTFQLLGNLTIHGVTRPVTWSVSSQGNGNDVTGQATANLKFEDFGMTPPKVAAVLSVNDDVKLEINFHMTKGS